MLNENNSQRDRTKIHHAYDLDHQRQARMETETTASVLSMEVIGVARNR